MLLIWYGLTGWCFCVIHYLTWTFKNELHPFKCFPKKEKLLYIGYAVWNSLPVSANSLTFRLCQNWNWIIYYFYTFINPYPSVMKDRACKYCCSYLAQSTSLVLHSWLDKIVPSLAAKQLNDLMHTCLKIVFKSNRIIFYSYFIENVILNVYFIYVLSMVRFNDSLGLLAFLLVKDQFLIIELCITGLVTAY